MRLRLRRGARESEGANMTRAQKEALSVLRAAAARGVDVETTRTTHHGAISGRVAQGLFQRGWAIRRFGGVVDDHGRWT